MSYLDLERSLRKNEVPQGIVVPASVAMRIEETLFALPLRPAVTRKRHFRKLIWTAAALGIFSILFFSAVRLSPEASKQLQRVPVMGTLVKKFEAKKSYSVTDKGITVTIDRVRDDGNFLLADLSFRASVELDQTDISYLLKLDDQLVTAGGKGRIIKTENGGYIAVIGDFSESHRDRYQYHLFVTQIGGQRGKWFFSIPSVSDTKNRFIVHPMMTKSSGDTGVILKEMIFSPLSTQAKIEQFKKPMDRILGFVMVDETGRTSVAYETTKLTALKDGDPGTIRFGPVAAGTRQVRLIPFLYDPRWYLKENKTVKVPLTWNPSEDEPIILRQEGGNDVLDVIGIEFLQDKTRVHVRMEEPNPFQQNHLLMLEDDKGEIHYDQWSTEFQWDRKDYWLEFAAVSPRISFVLNPVVPVTLYPELEMTVALPQ